MGLDSTLYKRHLIRGNNVKISIEIDGNPIVTGKQSPGVS